MLKIIIKILVLSIIFFIFSNCTYFQKRKSIKNGQKAIAIAENYIFNKYNQRMEYFNYVITSFGDSIYTGDRNIYHGKLINGQFKFYDFYDIVFTEINNDEFIFSVLVSFDFSYVVDSYIIDRFLHFSKTHFMPKIKNIWNNARTLIEINRKYYYVFNPPIEFDEEMNPEDVKYYIDINIKIFANSILTNANIKEEALKIFKTIEIIKVEDYKPDYIEFRFKTAFDGRHISIQLNNLDSIINVQEIERIINNRLEEFIREINNK
jgi:hypothetical protein